MHITFYIFSPKNILQDSPCFLRMSRWRVALCLAMHLPARTVLGNPQWDLGYLRCHCNLCGNSWFSAVQLFDVFKFCLFGWNLVLDFFGDCEFLLFKMSIWMHKWIQYLKKTFGLCRFCGYTVQTCHSKKLPLAFEQNVLENMPWKCQKHWIVTLRCWFRVCWGMGMENVAT